MDLIVSKAFADEFVKIAGGAARKGRRPMSVSTLLRKDKEGTIYKHKLAEHPVDQSNLQYADADEAWKTGRPALARRKPGDVPSAAGDRGAYPTSEERQNMAATPTVGSFSQADVVPKTGAARFPDSKREGRGKWRQGTGGSALAPEPEDYATNPTPMGTSLGDIAPNSSESTTR
jgi:hypothetical protein